MKKLKFPPPQFHNKKTAKAKIESIVSGLI